MLRRGLRREIVKPRQYDIAVTEREHGAGIAEACSPRTPVCGVNSTSTGTEPPAISKSSPGKRHRWVLGVHGNKLGAGRLPVGRKQWFPPRHLKSPATSRSGRALAGAGDTHIRAAQHAKGTHSTQMT